MNPKKYDLRPKTVEGYIVNDNPDTLSDIAKWCDGTLIYTCDKGKVVPESIRIDFSDPESNGRGPSQEAKYGEVLFRYVGDTKFNVVSEEQFKSVYREVTN